MQSTASYISTHHIGVLEPNVAEDVEGVLSARLNASVRHAVTSIGEREIFLLDVNQRVTAWERNVGKLISTRVARERVTLLRVVVLGSRNGLVNGFNCRVVNQAERGSGVGNGSVAARASNCLAVDGGSRAVEHPEALTVVNGRVSQSFPVKGILINFAESVERLTLVGIARVTPAAKIRGKKLRTWRDVLLGDHVGDWSRLWLWRDGVDAWPGETKQAISGILLELGRHFRGNLDGLALHRHGSESDIICANGARSTGTVAV